MALDLSCICIRQWNGISLHFQIKHLHPKGGAGDLLTTRDLLENADCLRPRALACGGGGGGGDVEIISHNSLARLLIDEDVGVCTLG